MLKSPDASCDLLQAQQVDRISISRFIDGADPVAGVKDQSGFDRHMIFLQNWKVSGRVFRGAAGFDLNRINSVFLDEQQDKDVEVEMSQDSFSGWQVASRFELLGIVC